MESTEELLIKAEVTLAAMAIDRTTTMHVSYDSSGQAWRVDKPLNDSAVAMSAQIQGAVDDV